MMKIIISNGRHLTVSFAASWNRIVPILKFRASWLTCRSLSLSLSLSLSPSLSLSLRASIAQLVDSRSCLRKDLSSIPASATTEWVTKKPLPSKSAEESQPWNPTGLPDLRSPCPGIIRLAGRTAGKSPSSQSEAARRAPSALTGWTPAAGKQKAARQYRAPKSRPDSQGA